MVFPVRFATIYRVIKKKKCLTPETTALLLSLFQVFRCQFNLWHPCYFYTAILATLSWFYSTSSCLMLQLETRWLQQAIITSLFRSLPSSAWSAAVRTSPIPSFIVIWTQCSLSAKGISGPSSKRPAKLAVLVRKILAEYNCHLL